MNIHKTFQLAVEYYQAGRLQQAERTFRKILTVMKNNEEAYYYLGNILYDTRRLEEAISCYEKCLELNPDFAGTHYNLGAIFLEKGALDKATSHFQKALQLDPLCADIHNTLGVIFQRRKQSDEAITHYQKTLELNPNFAAAYYNLGNIFHEQGDSGKAFRHYQKALSLNPDFAGAYYEMGNILTEKGGLDDARNCYQEVVKLDPRNARAHYKLGNIYREKGQNDHALDCYQKAGNLDPNLIAAHWAHCFSQIPMNYPNENSIQTCRTRYSEELVTLQKIISLDSPDDIDAASSVVGSQQPYYLAYQGLNDCGLQQIYGNFVCKIMALRYPEWASRPVRSFMPDEPIKVGIVSGYFCSHSNWKIPIKGWIENIDTQRFTLFGYSTGKVKDEETEAARKSFHRFAEDVSSFEDMGKRIRNDNLHIVIYPEIGMDPIAVRLAALPLAPVQCTSWGHPDTSGLPTIDYFLSSDLMEPHDAQDHYTERLVRLPNLSVYYTPLEIPAREANRESFNLRPRSVIYLCCQALMKYLPQYDEIYPTIAQRVGDCQFIFIADISDYVTGIFRSRMNSAFSRCGLNADEYIVFLPRLDIIRYHAVNLISDIYLDSIGWSGCNSTFEAIACNLPVITLPGTLMRGRHSAAILAMMGMKDTIASTLGEYIELAVKLAKNRELRQHISDKIASGKHRIYRDRTCITAFEDFLENAVKKKLH